MTKQITVVIDWYGPYCGLDAARKALETEWRGVPGLYALCGQQRYEKRARLHYIGRSKDLAARVGLRHPQLQVIKRELEVWLGEIVSQCIPGRPPIWSPNKNTRLLRLVETAHVFFLKSVLKVDLKNDRLTRKPPGESLTIVNRWWKQNGDPRKRLPGGIRPWPLLIDYRMGDEIVTVVLPNGKSEVCYIADL